MADIANLSLGDGLATPVNHVFTPVTSNMGSSGVAMWRDSTSGLTILSAPRITLRNGVVDPRTYLRRVRGAVEIPVMEVITGQNSAGYSAAPRVAHTVTLKFEAIVNARATEQQIKDARVFLGGALYSAPFIDAIDRGISLF